MNRLKQLEKIDNFINSVVKEKIYDLKHVLKLARSHKFKLTTEEQV